MKKITATDTLDLSILHGKRSPKLLKKRIDNI